MKALFRGTLMGTFAVVLSLAAGCGSDEGGDGSGGSNITSAFTCDTFTNEGSPVTPASQAGTAPSMSGGDLLDGTYILTAWDQYAGSSNDSTHQETFVFENGSWKHIAYDGSATILAGTFSTSGSTLTLNLECPQTTSLKVQYTATADSFSFVPPDDPNRVQTYTKL